MLTRGEPVVEMTHESVTSPGGSPTRPEFFDPPRLPPSDTDSLRKRHSIFGRSKSALTGMQSVWTLNSVRPQQSSATANEPPPSRPGSAAGSTRRSNTESGALLRWRRSFFEKTRRARETWNHDGEPEPMLQRPSSQFSRRDSRPLSHVGSPSEEEYYRDMKKNSISPPFNFQHVSHTARQQLPRLETVDEKQLTKEFWAASAYQEPKRHLNGIDAEDLAVKHREMGYHRTSLSSRPGTALSMRSRTEPTRMPSRLEHVVDHGDERSNYTPQPEAVEHRPIIRSPSFMNQQQHQQSWHPRRKSSLGALKDIIEASHDPLPVTNDPLARAQSTTRIPNEPYSDDDTSDVQARQLIAAANQDRDLLTKREANEVRDRAKQPLPPLPPHALSKSASMNSLAPARPVSTSQESCASTVDPLAESKRTTRSMRVSQVVSIMSDHRRPSLASNPSWEDDVDFCYEQAAESTCDFNWDHPPKKARVSMSPSMESDGGVRLSKWIAPFAMPQSTRDSVKLRPAASDDSIASRSQQQIRPRQSVGHRGFAAARKVDSHEKLAPTSLKIAESSSFLTPLSPISSIHTSEAPQPSPFTPNRLHFPNFDGSNSDYLSDPESIRTGGSRHRKSSSYGSYESFSRPTHQQHRSMIAARKSVIASLASIPDASPGGHKRSKSCTGPIDKSTISPPMPRPLSALPPTSTPSVPVLAPAENPQLEQTPLPRNSYSAPALPDEETMRRPQTPGDRAAMQAAGRAVQRGRPSTQNHSRASRFVVSPSPSAAGARVSVATTVERKFGGPGVMEVPQSWI